MFKRTLTFAAVMGAAVGIPYVSSQWSHIKANFTGGSGGGYARTSSYGSNSPKIITPWQTPDPAREETPIVEMNEAFRFDVTPAWVMTRWPRVTAGLTDDKCQGLRVPLITGMREDDLAGSITYYFTQSQRCAKITFVGDTGDPRRATAGLIERFGFKPFPGDEPGSQRYQIRWNGKAQSELTIRPAAVVRSSTPFDRYEIQMMVTDPSAR
jgi:Family of unknown function (DUF6690)